MIADIVRAPGSPQDLTFLAPVVGFGLFLLVVLFLRAYQARQRLHNAAATDRVVRGFNTPMKTRVMRSEIGERDPHHRDPARRPPGMVGRVQV